MKKLLVGAIASVFVAGTAFGGIEIARANNPEYQMKKNDELISEIIGKVTNSKVCKATKAEGFMKNEDTFLQDTEIATACMRLFNNQIEYITKIQQATSGKERKGYRKASSLLLLTSTRHE